jgi:hypothetical protein
VAHWRLNAAYIHRAYWSAWCKCMKPRLLRSVTKLKFLKLCCVYCDIKLLHLLCKICTLLNTTFELLFSPVLFLSPTPRTQAMDAWQIWWNTVVLNFLWYVFCVGMYAIALGWSTSCAGSFKLKVCCLVSIVFCEEIHIDYYLLI